MVLDAVKIEANGQVIADFGNSEDGELLLHISDKDTDKWQFAHGNSYDTGSDALLNRYKYNFTRFEESLTPDMVNLLTTFACVRSPQQLWRELCS